MKHKSDSALRNLRVARTMSQEDLAGLVGVTQETISKAERGLIRLTPDLQTRIAAILGSTRTELFPESEAVAS